MKNRYFGAQYVGDFIKVTNINIYGLDWSVKASALAKIRSLDELYARTELFTEDEDLNSLKRAKSLGNAPQGSGHDCFLKGITVQATFHFPQWMWQQAKRYHWFDIVTSTSTMHCITEFDLDEMCDDYVTPYIKEYLRELVKVYKETKDEEVYQRIISNIPSGLILPAAVTTNYMQLKTMYNQRKHHKMKGWREFCEWCECLPLFNELCIKFDK